MITHVGPIIGCVRIWNVCVYRLCLGVYSTVNNNFSTLLVELVIFNLQAEILKFDTYALIICVDDCL